MRELPAILTRHGCEKCTRSKPRFGCAICGVTCKEYHGDFFQIPVYFKEGFKEGVIRIFCCYRCFKKYFAAPVFLT